MSSLHQACGLWSALSRGFPRQKYSSGLPLPPPGDLPDPGTKPASPALADGFVTAEPSGKPIAGFTGSVSVETNTD